GSSRLGRFPSRRMRSNPVLSRRTGWYSGINRRHRYPHSPRCPQSLICHIMHAIEFSSYPVWLNGVILCAGGTVVWLSGTKLARLADAISEQTRLSRVLAGALLLGVATSLPEIATTITAGALENAP